MRTLPQECEGFVREFTHFGGNLREKRFGVWGLAFKPRTNDMRDAPAIKIIESLLAEGATVIAYDPEAMQEAKKIFNGRIELASNNYGCVEDADALLVVTEWQAFRHPNFERMKDVMLRLQKSKGDLEADKTLLNRVVHLLANGSLVHDDIGARRDSLRAHRTDKDDRAGNRLQEVVSASPLRLCSGFAGATTV
jgi:hypothetical protein